MLVHCSKSLHHPHFNHLAVLAAHRISKGDAGAGQSTTAKIMSVYGHGEEEDGKGEIAGAATDL